MEAQSAGMSWGGFWTMSPGREEGPDEGDGVGEHGQRTGWSPVGKVFPAPEAPEPFLEK